MCTSFTLYFTFIIEKESYKIHSTRNLPLLTYTIMYKEKEFLSMIQHVHIIEIKNTEKYLQIIFIPSSKCLNMTRNDMKLFYIHNHGSNL